MIVQHTVNMCGLLFVLGSVNVFPNLEAARLGVFNEGEGC